MRVTDAQIEKAAKAANAAACTSNPDVDVEELWGRLDPYEQDEWRRAVRAALEAVMPEGEPGELAPVEKCADCDGSGLALNMAGEPDVCPECRGDTVVPVELGEVERLREAARKARAVLAQAVSAGWNAGGPTLDDTDAAFWSLDAALAEGGRDE